MLVLPFVASLHSTCTFIGQCASSVSSMCVTPQPSLSIASISSILSHSQYVESKSEWKLDGAWKKTLGRELKRLSEAKKLVKVKSSYKLSDELKKGPPVQLCCWLIVILHSRMLAYCLKLGDGAHLRPSKRAHADFIVEPEYYIRCNKMLAGLVLVPTPCARVLRRRRSASQRPIRRHQRRQPNRPQRLRARALSRNPRSPQQPRSVAIEALLLDFLYAFCHNEALPMLLHMQLHNCSTSTKYQIKLSWFADDRP